MSPGMLMTENIKSKNPTIHAGSWHLKEVRRTGIEPVTLGLKALMSV